MYFYCGKRNAINPALGDGFYHPFLVILGVDSTGLGLDQLHHGGDHISTIGS
jgi:hypothetical protein